MPDIAVGDLYSSERSQAKVRIQMSVIAGGHMCGIRHTNGRGGAYYRRGWCPLGATLKRIVRVIHCCETEPVRDPEAF